MKETLSIALNCCLCESNDRVNFSFCMVTHCTQALVIVTEHAEVKGRTEGRIEICGGLRVVNAEVAFDLRDRGIGQSICGCCSESNGSLVRVRGWKKMNPGLTLFSVPGRLRMISTNCFNGKEEQRDIGDRSRFLSVPQFSSSCSTLSKE